MYEQVLLQDAEIDKIDKVIEKIDSSYLPNISSINSAITNVETAYDNRISIGCSNNLYWEPFTVIVSPGIAATAYRATEDPSQERSINFYGAKYYRKPLNQDYDSNIIEEFSGTISLGSSSLAIVGSALTFKYQIGDTIVDNIDNPVVFSSANLPAELTTVQMVVKIIITVFNFQMVTLPSFVQVKTSPLPPIVTS